LDPSAKLIFPYIRRNSVFPTQKWQDLKYNMAEYKFTLFYYRNYIK